MRSQVALITGITGQTGWYLANELAERDYELHGISSQAEPSAFPFPVQMHPFDLTVEGDLPQLVEQIAPHEVYHLAAQSHVGASFRDPIQTAVLNGIGTGRLLEAVSIVQEKTGHEIRFCHASSGGMYGATTGEPSEESSPFAPANPYACSKVWAHWQTVNYREAFELFACNGILFNHESPRREESFVTRKVTRAATRIKLGLQDSIRLGNLDVKRDWGFAGDYARALWLMLQQTEALDLVIATGETHSLREFLQLAFGAVDLDWQDYVQQDELLFRPQDEKIRCGDPSRAKELLGWEPRCNFANLVTMMVEADLKLAEEELRRAES